VIFDVSGEKKKENAFAPIITRAIVLKQFILLRLSKYCGIIPSTIIPQYSLHLQQIIVKYSITERE